MEASGRGVFNLLVFVLFPEKIYFSCADLEGGG